MLYTFITSLYYYPLKLYVTIVSLFYFKKVRSQGHENIPTRGPVVYAITHQNSLLDAYLSNCFSLRSPYYLVRADVFNNKFIDKVMRSIKTLPIYRIRDGYESMKKNDQIFEATSGILKKGKVVGIFPEGSHSLTHQLRPLKKGIARIAFMADASEDFTLDVKIVPIGISYDAYFSSRSRTLISYGKPINIADYKQTFLEDENKAYRAMLTELSLRMKSLIVHVSSEDYDKVYSAFKKRRVYKKSLTKQLKSDQELVRCIEQGEKFSDASDKVPLLLKPIENIFSGIRFVLAFVPKRIVAFMVKKMIRDENFIGTMMFTFSMVIYPVFYILVYQLIRVCL